MSACLQRHPFKQVEAEGWACSGCLCEFVHVGAPNFCPVCGNEFDGVQRINGDIEKAK